MLFNSMGLLKFCFSKSIYWQSRSDNLASMVTTGTLYFFFWRYLKSQIYDACDWGTSTDKLIVSTKKYSRSFSLCDEEWRNFGFSSKSWLFLHIFFYKNVSLLFVLNRACNCKLKEDIRLWHYVYDTTLC